ncbi:hypothetical protein M2150_001702 [Lachnospiraceae bacterium PM6-15]|uniref:DUF5688 family protein n=1 Tax=Ohessyouella blattaphilus TaxID=2949333 RepID=UPI003E19F716
MYEYQEMSFQEFCSKIMSKLSYKYLPEGSDYEWETVQVTKNNEQKYTGVVLKKHDESAQPVLPLEKYYGEMCKGRGFEAIVLQIAEDYQSLPTFKKTPLSIDSIPLEDNIVAVIVDKQKNKDLLNDLISLDVGNGLTLIYKALLSNPLGDGEIATVRISKQMASRKGLTVDDIHQWAVNRIKEDPIEFMSMDEVMNELFLNEKPEREAFHENMALEKDSVMYTLSNESRFYGASVFFYPEVQETIKKVLGEGYYMLPSSVHEVIIVPESKALNIEIDEMAQMVKAVNASTVDKEEQIADMAYYYDETSKTLVKADEIKAQKPPKKKGAR